MVGTFSVPMAQIEISLKTTGKQLFGNQSSNSGIRIGFINKVVTNNNAYTGGRIKQVIESSRLYMSV